MRLKFFVILMVLTAGFNHAASQELIGLPKIIPMAPEVTNHIRNIQYPVSYSHGSVDISIPLYEIVVGDMTIPISISYNHKGVRPFEYTYWLGQGWSLNAEPSISRKANGKPDVHCEYIPADDQNHTEKRYENYADNPIMYAQYLNLYWTYLAQNYHANLDEFPDEYYYDIPGKSGAFIYNWSKSKGFTPATMPYEPIKIAYEPHQPKKNTPTGTFYITDDNGNVFTFGVTDYHTPSSFSSPTTWRCNKITTRNGEVTFNYSKSTEQMNAITEAAIIEDEYWLGGFGGYATIPNIQCCDRGFALYAFPGPITNYEFMPNPDIHSSLPPRRETNNFVCTQRINKISFPNGYALFNHTIRKGSTGASDRTTLKEIEIYDASNTLIRTIKFEHNFSSIDYPILNSVKIIDGNGQVQDSYTFDYYDKFPSDDHDININFWGYHNNQTLGTLIHNDYVQINYRDMQRELITDLHFQIGNGNRLPPASTAGVLKSVSTLSGAVTEFEYESDQFKRRRVISATGEYEDKVVNSGGLRIKTIKQFDHTKSPVIERHFKYGENENGIGFSRINIDHEEYMHAQIVVEHLNPVGRRMKRVRTLSAHLHGDVTLSGTPIVYDCVTEYIKGYDEKKIRNFGKTIYRFDYVNYYDPMNHGIKYPGSAYIPCPLRGDNKAAQWGKGQLLSKKIFKYDEDFEAFIPEQTIEYTYTTINKETIKAGQACIVETDIPYDTNTGSQIAYKARYDYHYMYTGCRPLLSQKDTYHTSGGDVTHRTTYTYDNREHMYPTRVVTIGSDGTTHTQTLKYPQDVTGITDSEHATAITKMLAKNIVSPLIEQSDISGGSTRTIYNKYTSDVAKTPSGWPVQYQLAIKDNSNNKEEARIIYHKYDSKGNPIYATKDGVTNVVYLWGYNGQHLVAAIENTTYDQVQSALRTSGILASSETLGSLQIYAGNLDIIISSLRNSSTLDEALITTFKYKILTGITEITDPRGITTFYYYDSFGRLASIKDNEGNRINEYQYHFRVPNNQ